MKSIIPNLFIDNCKENLYYYKNIFGGELNNIVPGYDATDKIMHAELHINKDCILYFGDKLGEALQDPNIHIFLKFDSEAEIQKVYDSLKKEGEIEIELKQSFWGTLHAVVIDKNGLTWDLDK